LGRSDHEQGLYQKGMPHIKAEFKVTFAGSVSTLDTCTNVGEGALL
jgi:hypothetical protein